ncbi:MAG: glycosyltransferase family 39 protein [Candidatus Eremiobacteraeota bacterium]|nr:glycosyltransferase family 39 protein [Candidatus Eremiobacteraeota bacterium]
MQNPTRVALIGALIAAMLTLPGLGNGTLWDNSETAYGEVAREILLLHDAVVMHLNGAAWFVQPPLYFWIAAFFAKIFGVGSFALRLPSALATIAMAAMTGYAVTRAAGLRAGMYAAIILSTSLMQAILGRLAIMDALLDLAVALALFWWWRALESGRDRYVYFGWAAAAFGFLAKGPVALVISLLVIIPFYFWNRRTENMQRPRLQAWVLGACIFAAIVLPWLLMLVSRSGAESVIQLLGHYTFGRYTGTIENQAGPVWYYLPVLILGFFPWVAFLPAAMVYGINQARNSGVDDGNRGLVRLALIWIVMPFLFFSFAKTKLPNYIALELPGLALLVALYFESIVQRYRRRSLMISAAAIPVTIACLAVAIVMFSHQNRLTADAHNLSGDLLAVGGALFVGSILTTLLFLSERTALYAPHVLGAASFIGISVLAVVALPQAEQFKPIPRLANIIQRERAPGDAVAISGVPGGNALVFYTQPVVQTLAAADVPNPVDLAAPRTVICTSPRVFVVTSKRRPAFDPTYGRTRRLLAVDNNDALFLYEGARCAP